MAHVNHIISWRAGGFTVTTVDDDVTSGNNRRRATARLRALRGAMELHAAAMRDPAVARSVVLVVRQGGAARVVAAAPNAGSFAP